MAALLKAARGFTTKLAALPGPIIYNAKVVGEIAKQVYVKEGLAFPTAKQVTEARATLQGLNLAFFKNLSLSDLSKGGIIFAEVAGFFFIGEVIGKRNLIGYAVESASPRHH